MFAKKHGSEESSGGPAATSEVRQTAPVTAFCRVCKAYKKFSRTWLRVSYVRTCPCCSVAVADVEQVYKSVLPTCRRCGEYLEHPGFQYGLCDGCGSKFELVAGGKPGLLPNKKQRDAMDRWGKTWVRG